MQFHISGRHVDLGASFQQHVETRLQEGLTKYLDRVTNVDIVVSKAAHQQFQVDILGNTGTHAGIMLKSQGKAGEVYAAFDDAATKVEKQLRRYKRRLKDHHNREAAEARITSARKYVLQPEAHDTELDEKGAPVVVAETSTDIATLSVSDAVMKMDLADLPALMFYNSGSGRLNVIYRRADGNISWVDPEAQAA
jgi:ribosomal subunit interface protein